MAGTTPNLGLYLPGGGSTGEWTPDEVADVDPINQNFQKIDQFAGSVGNQTTRNQQFTGPAGAISGVTGMKLGDEYQDSDTQDKRRWRFNGVAWRPYEFGVSIIRPTTVVNGFHQNEGHTTFSGQTTVSLNGVFASYFREYEIQFEAHRSTPGAVIQLRMRAAGVDASTSVYHYRRAGTLGAGYVEATNAAVNRFEFSIGDKIHQITSVRITDAEANAFTRIYNGVTYDTDDSVFGQTFNVTGEHRLQAVYDGFTLFVSAGTIAGEIRVLGLA